MRKRFHDYVDLRIGSLRIHWFYDWDRTFLYVQCGRRYWRLWPSYLTGLKEAGK